MHLRVITLIFITLWGITRPSFATEAPREWLSFREAMAAHEPGQVEVLIALQLMQAEKTDENASGVLDLLKSAQNQGHPCAYFILSFNERDAKQRIELLRFAYQHKLQPSVYPLADALYQHGRGSESDYPEALELFLLAGQGTHQDAQFYAGRMYHFGDGTEIDYTAAREWYTRAVENGSVRAGNNLGNLWANGQGGLEDLNTAMNYLRNSSEQGMGMASYNLAEKFRLNVPDAPDWDNARIYYERAVEQADGDDPDSAYWAGRIQQFGFGNIPIDLDKAIYYLELAAAGDNSKALFSLGWIYESGQLGVPDLRTANQFYERSAKQGHTAAMGNFAWSLWKLEGDDIIPKAEPYFLESIAAGNSASMCNFGYLNLYEKWPEADPKYGLELMMQAAELKHETAIRTLIYYYQGNGDLTEPNPQQVAYWRKQLKKD